MGISPSLLPALLLFHLLIICKSLAIISQSSSTGGDGHRHLIDEIREAELKVVRLGKLFFDLESSFVQDPKFINAIVVFMIFHMLNA